MVERYPHATTGFDFSEALAGLRSVNAEDFDAALIALRQNLAVIKADLHSTALSEPDPRVRGALIELLGATRDPTFIDFIAEQLENGEKEVKFWALAALQTIGTHEALVAASRFVVTDRRRPSFASRNSSRRT